jgi:hypothetical protein
MGSNNLSSDDHRQTAEASVSLIDHFAALGTPDLPQSFAFGFSNVWHPAIRGSSDRGLGSCFVHTLDVNYEDISVSACPYIDMMQP